MTGNDRKHWLPTFHTWPQMSSTPFFLVNISHETSLILPVLNESSLQNPTGQTCVSCVPHLLQLAYSPVDISTLSQKMTLHFSWTVKTSVLKWTQLRFSKQFKESHGSIHSSVWLTDSNIFGYKDSGGFLRSRFFFQCEKMILNEFQQLVVIFCSV